VADAPIRPGEACLWCGKALVTSRSRGSAKRFCTTEHRQAFWTAARRWVERALQPACSQPQTLEICRRRPPARISPQRSSDPVRPQIALNEACSLWQRHPARTMTIEPDRFGPSREPPLRFRVGVILLLLRWRPNSPGIPPLIPPATRARSQAACRRRCTCSTPFLEADPPIQFLRQLAMAAERQPDMPHRHLKTVFS